MSGAPKAPEARNRYEGDVLLGTVLNGKFAVRAVLANGGMGRIYRGEQIPLGRPVAIKVLHSKYTSSQEDPAFQKRFFLEASILSKLQHTNIVTVFDYGRIENTEDESYFIAMEFLHGETLHRRLRALGALPPVEAIGIVRQIARGLREAHRQGVVHRDLKPSNIMLVPEDDGHEIIKIIDFGLVKVLADDSEELTKEGSFLGSPRYMSPEQIAHGRVDHRTDIYSLGVILYQCLCGRTPFENENSVHTLMAHLQLPVPAMRERNPAIDVPEVLETFARRCLEKDPINRPSTMEDFLRGLRECEVTLGLSSASLSTGSGQYGSGASHPLPVAAHNYSDASLTSNPSGSLTSNPSASLTSNPSASLTSNPLPAITHGSAAHAAAPYAPVPSAPFAAAPALASATPIAAQPPPPANRALPIALALVAVIACALVALLVLGRSSTTAPPPVTNAPAVDASAAPRPSEGLREYRLVIACDTTGAQVFEGDSLLGATPLTLVVDNNAVRTAPRRFEVRHDGYDSFPVEATVSENPSVRVLASLTPSAAAPPPQTQPGAQTAARPTVGRPTARPPRPPTPPHAPDPNDDIRSHR
ncbi:MAG: serine/threonine-protein kinase [Polyangiales bacterium]